MGQQMVFPNGMPWQRKSPGQSSRVATSLLAMELEHDTGRMDGEVLAGPFKGRRLSSLTLEETQRLHAQAAGTPDQSRALLEAWIERTHPEWREKWNAGARVRSRMALAEDDPGGGAGDPGPQGRCHGG